VSEAGNSTTLATSPGLPRTCRTGSRGAVRWSARRRGLAGHMRCPGAGRTPDPGHRHASCCYHHKTGIGAERRGRGRRPGAHGHRPGIRNRLVVDSYQWAFQHAGRDRRRLPCGAPGRRPTRTWA